ncbi:MAG: hypothetical protein LBJ96_04845 [Holosporaceae bacterium]|jgi:hypothetical protein|nr:hypothetical protein [Holosporaceae bacterium]
MPKLLFIIVSVFLATDNFVYATDENVNSIDKNVESVKNALNGALGLPSKSPMFIVKVRRQVLHLKEKEVAPGKKARTRWGKPVWIVDEEKQKTPFKGKTPLISNDEFEQLLKLLYSLCSNQGAPIHPKRSILRSRQNVEVTADNVASVDALCGDLAAYKAKINDACTLVVFNESLFSQDPPLESSQKNFILDQLKILSSSSPNTVFYPNFLFTEMRGNTKEEAMAAQKEMEDNEKIGRMIFKNIDDYPLHCTPTTYSGKKTENVFGKKSNNEKRQIGYLLNETIAIHGGEVLTAYKKFTYFSESNETIHAGGKYDFGEGKDVATDVSEDHENLQKVLLENISTEICYDLAYGVRYKNGWTNLTEPSKLHIIPSNFITAFGRAFSDNISHLPLGVGIINADPHLDRRSDGIPYCKAYQVPPELLDDSYLDRQPDEIPPYHKDQASHELLDDSSTDNEKKINMIAYLTDADNKSYEAVIGSSRYIITICKI